MAGATGAIVIFDNGKSLKWRDKCEGCGHVGSVIHISSSPSYGMRRHYRRSDRRVA